MPIADYLNQKYAKLDDFREQGVENSFGVHLDPRPNFDIS